MSNFSQHIQSFLQTFKFSTFKTMESNTSSAESNTTKPLLNNINANMAHNNEEANSLYYGVHIPSDMSDNDGYSVNVFQDKIEALKLVKKYKKARFKAFTYYHEAADFAVHGSECSNNITTENFSFYKTNLETSNGVGEKPCQFRGPKSQDLVKLRKGIESGDVAFVYETVWDNPRYLISSGDTPSILQEGSRYNALHVAAKAKNHIMAELILSTVSDVKFVKLLYGDESHQNAEDRAKILLDLYLNTPDKGLNETPLHFAVKFAAAKVVEVLVSYPQCDKNLKNKYGRTPKMIICERYDGCDATKIKDQISLLLDDNYYVPVFRSEDSCIPPVIGEPFSPTRPPNINSDPLSPRMEIHAYAGPMNKDGAEKFRRMWKTPPRSMSFETPKKRAQDVQINSVFTLKYKDPEKGLERLGQNLANKCEVGWKEYWPFLDSFVDIASTEGLHQFEAFLSTRLTSELDYSKLKYLNTAEKGSGNSSPTDHSNDMSTISDLCHAIENWNLSENSMSLSPSSFIEKQSNVINCSADFFKQDVSPIICIEKSCQVFAQRISNDILHLLETEFNNSFGVLETQIQQLELLMTSYMDDIRFANVNFHLVHSRLGLLISSKLRTNIKLEDEHNLIHKTIEKWLENCSKHLDCFSSDDESVNHKQTVIVTKKSTSKNKQVMCLLECILCTLSNDSDTSVSEVNTDDDCIKVWSEAKPCTCVWQTKSSKRTLSRNNSFKCTVRSHQSSFRNELENISRKLSFDDFGDLECNIIKENNGFEEKENIEANLEDKYFTPPSSPSFVEECDEVFEDSQLPETEIFIEGTIPTKTDYAVFNALQYSKCILSPNEYPNIYKWHHSVSLFSQNERESWPSPSIARINFKLPNITSTPTSAATHPKSNYKTCSVFTPPNSWLRITGINSPRRPSVQSYDGSLSSQNL